MSDYEPRWWPAAYAVAGSIVNIIARADQDPDKVGLWLHVDAAHHTSSGIALEARDANGTRYTGAFPAIASCWHSNVGPPRQETD